MKIMYIEPWICDNCGKTGYPGEIDINISLTNLPAIQVYCGCGNTENVDDGQDLMIMSTNSFARLTAASNYFELGQIELKPGESTIISFDNQIDFPCKAYFGPQGPVQVKELNLHPERMIVICASFPDQEPSQERVAIGWSVYGLRDIPGIPAWYIQFYSGITNIENGFFKAAILDYAVAFEIFLESYLRPALGNRYDQQVAEFLLKRSWRVEERCKQILELATGHRLSERDDVFQPWDQNVRNIRNRLVHGEQIPISQAEAIAAHQATYQAIRWIEGIS